MKKKILATGVILAVLFACYGSFMLGSFLERERTKTQAYNFARNLSFLREGLMYSDQTDTFRIERNEFIANLKKHKTELPFVIFPAFFEQSTQLSEWDARHKLLFAVKPSPESPIVITQSCLGGRKIQKTTMAEIIASQEKYMADDAELLPVLND